MVYAWLVNRIERFAPEKLDEVLSELEEPLPWQDSNSESAVDLESQSFLAMQAKGGR